MSKFAVSGESLARFLLIIFDAALIPDPPVNMLLVYAVFSLQD